MRPEKKYLVQEAENYLENSGYFFLTDYHGINAEQTVELRDKLSQRGAEFHVVKNSSLKIATKQRNLGDLEEHLKGHTAIVIGGDDISGVAKELQDYFKKNDKVSVKAGAIGEKSLTADEVKTLAKLPNLEVLRAQFLSLLNTPATQVVSLMNAPARNFVQVLQAKADQ